MSQELATIEQQPSARAIQRKTASKPGKVTGKLAVACKRIVWEGEELDAAAKAAGLTTRAVRLALERPHVIAFVKAERDVFRAHVSAQNIHRLKELRDGSANAMAKLGAIRTIESLDSDAPAGGMARTPGITIVIGSASPLTAQQRSIDHNPLNNQGSVSETRVISTRGVPFGGESDD